MLAFRSPCPLIGVAHLPPLPGAPRLGPGLEACLQRALRDARTLAAGGAEGIIIENLGDAPFDPDRVEPHVAAALAIIAREVKAELGDRLLVGVNALRNDAQAAAAAAAMAGADFIRVNVHSGVMVTDQGILQGRARETLQYRQRLAPELCIAADVLVKHAAPLGEVNRAQVARDTALRAGADVLIVTGSGTGQPTDVEELRVIKEAVPGHPVWVGSGLSPEHAAAAAPWMDGAIVGTWLHRGGDLEAPLDLQRVREMTEALRSPTPAP